MNGEYYTSLTYLPLIQAGSVIKTVPMTRFFQWGTPEDVADWEYWHRAIKRLNLPESNDSRVEGSTVILAAGLGSRTQEIGLPPKPLIEIGSHKLWEYAGKCAVSTQEALIVTRDHLIPEDNNLGLQVINLTELTLGQAISAEVGLKKINNSGTPVSIFSCDNVIYKLDLISAHRLAQEYDLIVWTAKSYPSALQNPKQFSWIKNENHQPLDVFIKETPANFKDYSVIIGNFSFRDRSLALELVRVLKERDIRINGEFYLDSVISLAIEMGFKVKSLEVKDFFAIGTSFEYQTYKYWFDVSREYEISNEAKSQETD